MEGAFKSRLDQVFGGLGDGTGRTPAALWSVSSTQVERRQWKTDEENQSDEDEDYEQQLHAKEEDEEHEDGDEQAPKRFRADRENAGNQEYMEVEDMVGMDTALDFEDEEDEYDKVAVGRQGAGDRIYTSDVNANFDNLSVLPGSYKEMRKMARDSRALRKAAADRIAEDAMEAKMNGNTEFFLQEMYKTTSCMKSSEKRKQEEVPQTKDKQPLEKKRVRFSDEGEEPKEDGDKDIPLKDESIPQKDPKGIPQDRQRYVPDHVRHPEKYTHYTLDWSEEDRGGNKAMDAVDSAKEKESTTTELPQHIAFVPRAKKDKEGMECDVKSPSTAGTVTARVAAMAGIEDVNELDNMEFKAKPQRSYRSRARDEED